MPALPTVVTDYLTAIKDALKLGTDLGSNVRGAAANYLRAQDMATVLDLLQDAMDQSATMTVVDATPADTQLSLRSIMDGVQSTETLTFTGVAVDTQTITIGSKVYTTQTALTDVDGNVLIGADAAATVANLVAAITLGPGAGTLYAASMTEHPTFTALDGTGDTVEIYAKEPGVAANGTATTETQTNASWGAAVTSGGVDAFGPAELEGHVVVFDPATTTALLQGVEARIHTNTEGRITFLTDLPALPVAGDTYTIRGGWFDEAIAELREGKGLAASPAGSIYGEYRTVADALVTALRRRGTHASEVLTFTGVGVDTQTVTLGGKTYTWQDSLTDSDGNVLIAGTAEGCIDNLVAAITLGPGAGTTYATSTTAHPDCTASKLSATEMTGRALLVGTAGNALVSTETGTNTAWGDTTLSGGLAGGSGTVSERTMSHPSLEVGTGSTDTVVVLESLGVVYTTDQFRGMKVVVGSEAPRIVVTSGPDTLTVAPALSSAPTATTAVTLTIPEDDVGGIMPKLRVHPGAQAGENAMLADLIEQVEAAMTSYVLPV